VHVVHDLLLNTVRDYRLQRNHQPRVRGVHAALLGGHRLRGNPMHPDHQPGLRTAPTATTTIASTLAAPLATATLTATHAAR